MLGRILITGSGGQIGTELTDNLIRLYGEENVIATDVFPIGRKDCSTAILDVTDGKAMEKILMEEGIQTIIHLAAILSAKGEKIPDAAFDINVNGMRNVLNSGMRTGANRIFFPSTIGIFGPDTPKDNVPIETITRPTTIYGITKLLCEQLGEYYFTKYGLDVRGMRLPGIISYKAPPGGGTTDYSIEMLRAAAEGRKYRCFLSEQTRLPMMYMPDAIDSITRLLEAPGQDLRHRTSFNVMAFSFGPADLETEIRKSVPDFAVSYVPDERQRIADSWPRSLDSSAAAEEWGFSPKYTLAMMVEDMLFHLKESGKVAETGRASKT